MPLNRLEAIQSVIYCLLFQSLYEAKLLSYPRTDCTYSTDEEFDYLVDNLTKYLDLVSNPVSLTNTISNKRYVNGNYD